MDLVDLETPLSKWMREVGISAYEVAKRSRVSYKQVCKLRDGESLPSLVTAFRIDRVTNGAVPPVAWLATPLGRNAWSQTHDWEKWMQQRRDEQLRARQRAAQRLVDAQSAPVAEPPSA